MGERGYELRARLGSRKTGLSPPSISVLTVLTVSCSCCLGKSFSFGLPRVPFVNYCLFMYLVISLWVLRAGYGI